MAILTKIGVLAKIVAILKAPIFFPSKFSCR